MHRLLSTSDVRALEERFVASTGRTLYDLMSEAGKALAGVVEERVPAGDIVVLTGSGNNGGDGWSAAQELHCRGRDVRVLTMKPPDELQGPAHEAAARAVGAGVPWAHCETLKGGDLGGVSGVVDALLGTGGRLPLKKLIAQWCRAVNESSAYVISADAPTGIDSDSGKASDDAIAADTTLTFICPKRGLVQYPAAAYAGEVIVADLGVADFIPQVPGEPEVWTREDYAELLPIPAPHAHKNDRGRLLIVAGSGRYVGAAVLAARGALRAGAGYVTLAVPEPIVSIVQGHLLSSPVIGLPSGRNKTLSSAALAAALDLARDYDAVLVGPGLTLSDGAAATARGLVSDLKIPLVLDADALNALIDASELVASRRAPTLLTPHPGELARLLGTSIEEVQADRLKAASALGSSSCAVVLKGAGTVIGGEGRTVVNTSGSWALATAGTGDVLAGVAASFVAQGLSPLAAGALAAYVHGRAGDAAAQDLTPICVNSEDVSDYLPSAFRELLGVW